MNPNEFVSLISPFKDKIFRLAKRLLISKEEAQDAAQEVVLKLWNKKEDITTWKSLEAMALTFTKNYCLDVLKSKRSSTISLVTTNYMVLEDLGQEVENKNALLWISKIIDNLPAQQKMLVQLREIEQMEFSEISEITGMTQVAIRVSLSRSRKIIKEKMHEIMSYGTK